MKYTLTTATEDSAIFRQGFVMSPSNYGQELEQAKTKSLEDTDGQKGRSSQSMGTASENKPILNKDSAVSNTIAESNTSSPGETSRLRKIFCWLKLLVKVFSDKFLSSKKLKGEQ